MVTSAATAGVAGALGSRPADERKRVREQLEMHDQSTLARLLELLTDANQGGTPAR